MQLLLAEPHADYSHAACMVFWSVKELYSCRSFGNPGSKMKEHCGPALAMSITKRLLRGSREELQDITFTIEALATQICPAALHPLKAILRAASVPSAVQQIPGTAAHFGASAYKLAYVEQALP